MKRLPLIALVVLVGAQIFAQQDPLYSQYMFNTLSINPAYAGSRNVSSVTALSRVQWTGLDGAPRTHTLTYDTPVGRQKKTALGLRAFTDKLGVIDFTGLNAIYAYRLRFSDKGTLSFGLQVGAASYNGRFSGVRLDSQNGSDVAFGADVNKWVFNTGIGAYYSEDRYYISVSAPQLLTNALGPDTGESYNLVDEARQYTHLFLSAGYVVHTRNQDIKLKPSFLLKYVTGSPIQGDINMNVWFADRFAIGASYRTDAAAVVLAELQLSDQLRVGYAYDLSTNTLGNFNSGSHELLLRYEFGFKNRRIRGPRYF